MATLSCDLLVVCEGVSIDKLSNSTTLFSIYDQTTASGFPLLVRAFVIYFVLIRDEIDPNLERVRVKLSMDFNGSRMSDNEVELNFAGKLRARNRSTVNGLVIPGPGNLKLSLTHGENVLKTYTVQYINRIETQAVPAPTITEEEQTR